MTGFKSLNPYIACLGPITGGSTGLPEVTPGTRNAGVHARAIPTELEIGWLVRSKTFAFYNNTVLSLLQGLPLFAMLYGAERAISSAG